MSDTASHSLLYIICYSVAIIVITLIVLLVLARQRTVLYRSFAAFGAFAGIWLALQFLSQLFYSNQTVAIVLLRVAIVASVYMAGAFVVFVRFYIGKPLKLSAYVLGACIMLLVTILGLTPENIRSAQITAEGIAIESAGSLYPFLFGLTVTFFIYGLATVFRFAMRRRQEKPVKRQALVLFIAVGQALLINAIFGNASSGILLTQLLVPFTSLLMIGLIAYAIIKHKLFDVRVFAVRALAYTITFASTGLLYVTPAVAITASLSGVSLGLPALTLLALVTFTVALLFQPMRSYFNKVTNKLFFRDYYDPQDVLDRLSNLLVGTVSVQEIKRESSLILSKALRPLSIRFVLTAEKNSEDDDRLLRLLLQSSLNMVITDELNGEQSYDRLHKELKASDIALALRLKTKHEDLGFLIFGFRQSGAIYNYDDQRLLTLMAGEIAISLQNALRFEEIEQFNETLQQKIEDATTELQQKNRRLRLLDRTKDDFISMASHQLRTPLTSVKGYVSMVLDGDAGALNEQQRKLLNQSFVSSQRMAYLISDLLNVSRLRTGKFIIEAMPCDLSKVIEQEVSQLIETAKSRELTLTYHKPDSFPILMLDENKLRQVIMNFIDNAIYYTPGGGHIDVYLEEKPQSIEFRVVDDGIGVPRAEQHHLFSKFYRAGNAQRMRPDGTGLGIFMAKKVVISQGGAVIFKSKEGIGSTFGFVFPKAKLLPPENKK